MILTVNIGSSTAKLAVFDLGDDPKPIAATEVTRAGHSAVNVWPDEFAAISRSPTAVVHRIVHGGAEYVEPTVITPAVLAHLGRMQRFAPDHLPPALEAVETAVRVFPDARQFACFDTAFHRHMPTVARMYPLARRYWDAGIRRYGFHGLSCESIMEGLGRIDATQASGRVIVAHLGGGSSLTAIVDGRSVDTTMGFSPAGGVMMGSRSGDLDPGVLLYVMEHESQDAAALRQLVTREAGLKGVSGRTADMRQLLAAEASDAAASEAVNLYCYLLRKALGSLIAVLGGMDTLVFTGGIGEHAAPIRERVLAGMSGLGFQVDPLRNRSHDAVISSTDSAVTIRVMPSNEDSVLASHARALLLRST